MMNPANPTSLTTAQKILTQKIGKTYQDNYAHCQESDDIREIRDDIKKNPALQKLYQEYRHGTSLNQDHFLSAITEGALRSFENDSVNDTVTGNPALNDLYRQYQQTHQIDRQQLQNTIEKELVQTGIITPSYIEDEFKQANPFIQSDRYNNLHDTLSDEPLADGFCMDGDLEFINIGKSGDNDSELILVDQQRDATLKATLQDAQEEFAKSPSKSDIEKIKFIFNYVNKKFSKVSAQDSVTLYRTISQWAKSALGNQPDGKRPIIQLGDAIDAGAGICRHKALLTKLLANQLGLKASLERGIANVEKSNSGGHAWNEITTADNQTFVMDTSLGVVGKKPKRTGPTTIQANNMTVQYRKAKELYDAVASDPETKGFLKQSPHSGNYG